MPCFYREYRIEGTPTRAVTPSEFPFVLGIMPSTTEVTIETETVVFPWTSLLAEFGGTLGLFIGFSFMTIWDCLVDLWFMIQNRLGKEQANN